MPLSAAASSIMLAMVLRNAMAAAGLVDELHRHACDCFAPHREQLGTISYP